jgi:hypothetical protein
MREAAKRFASAFAPPAPVTGAKPDTALAEISTGISYLPDLHAYLDDLLRTRERVLAAAGIDQWARAEAAPSQEEITRIRQLITRVENGLGDLTDAEREQVSQPRVGPAEPSDCVQPPGQARVLPGAATRLRGHATWCFHSE